MIVKCLRNKRVDLPVAYRDLGFPEGTDEDTLDITPGFCYLVYATKIEDHIKSFLVHTDTMNTDSWWWMPDSLYEVVDSAQPAGWITGKYADAEVSAYPALFDWKIQDGIMDGETLAINKYAQEVADDPSFPTQEILNEYNVDYISKQAAEKFEEDERNARERGWEKPLT